MRLALAAVIAGGLVTVACSGGGDAEPAETSASVTVVSTTERVVDTTEPPVTDPPTTTEPAPATTELSTEALIAEIEADLNEGEQALFAAGADPSNPALRQEMARYNVGLAHEQVLEFMDTLTADGLRMRPNPDVDNTVTVLAVLDSAGVSATVDLCRIDAAVIYRPTVNGGETIVNDAVETSRSRTQLALIDGTWAVANGERISLASGANSCDES